ncbi:glycosyltransferase [Methylorubrum sp. SB2]|uniref:glycosyltransferase n=1 Tax=Methylorubrum subtropicum TaxID=3138812 RepID=UPI00313BE19D
MHVQWEEFALTGCADELEARRRGERFAHVLEAYQNRGGRVVLTIHNEEPHSGVFIDTFMMLRRAVGRLADLVLVHDAHAAELMRRQIGDAARIAILPHPSSLDVYESAATLTAALPAAPSRTLLGFGAMRAQKGFADMINHLPPEFLAERGARLRFSGVGDVAASLAECHGDRTDIDFDIRYVPDDEVPALLRGSAAVVLPYKRMLTSGVALLTMSCGGVIVAPDLPPMRLLLPEVGHNLLFRPDDADDFRRAADAALTLSQDARRLLIAEGLDIARAHHPRIVSARLSTHYDILLSRKV